MILLISHLPRVDKDHVEDYVFSFLESREIARKLMKKSAQNHACWRLFVDASQRQIGSNDDYNEQTKNVSLSLF